jgi:hypothetical protein
MNSPKELRMLVKHLDELEKYTGISNWAYEEDDSHQHQFTTRLFTLAAAVMYMTVLLMPDNPKRAPGIRIYLRKGPDTFTLFQVSGGNLRALLCNAAKELRGLGTVLSDFKFKFEEEDKEE